MKFLITIFILVSSYQNPAYISLKELLSIVENNNLDNISPLIEPYNFNYISKNLISSRDGLEALNYGQNYNYSQQTAFAFLEIHFKSETKNIEQIKLQTYLDGHFHQLKEQANNFSAPKTFYYNQAVKTIFTFRNLHIEFLTEIHKTGQNNFIRIFRHESEIDDFDSCNSWSWLQNESPPSTYHAYMCYRDYQVTISEAYIDDRFMEIRVLVDPETYTILHVAQTHSSECWKKKFTFEFHKNDHNNFGSKFDFIISSEGSCEGRLNERVKPVGKITKKFNLKQRKSGANLISFSLVNGYLEGEVKIYDHKGILISTGTYKKGVLIRQELH